ncbi:MAG TPA: matrixin family metalloprotease [Deltaproteobacteria bacterium]|nr:matrixin family metalloprotease [Deltaproteobacteria bacterium]
MVSGLLLSILSSPAPATSTTQLGDGTEVRWTGAGGARPYLPIVINPSNASGLSGHEVEAAVVEGLLSWQAATGRSFAFDVWVGTEELWYPTSQEMDGYSTVHFASRDPEAGLTGGQAGYTDLFYDTTTGSILEADIVLNDVSFFMTADPAAATYADEGLLGKTLYLGDVVTHELGHLLGLGHTGVSSSTMFPGAWSEQTSLGCDDVLGIRELYSPSDQGVLSGTVTIDRMGRWAAMEVSVVSLDRRTVVAAAFTDDNGQFAIRGLESGRYLVMAGPYLGDPAGLPAQLAEDFALPCDVSRGLAPGVVELASGGGATVALTLECQGGIELLDARGTLESPTVLEPGEGQLAGGYRVETGAEGAWFLIPGIEGNLSIDVLSFSMFSPARVEAQLTDLDGIPLSARITHPLEDRGDTSVWDTRLEAFGIDGDVLLHLESYFMPSASYPGNATFLDPNSFALIVGAVGEELWEAPAGCAPSDLSTYSTPGGYPARSWQPAAATEGRGCAVGVGTGGSGLGVSLFGLLAYRRRRILTPRG